MSAPMPHTRAGRPLPDRVREPIDWIRVDRLRLHEGDAGLVRRIEGWIQRHIDAGHAVTLREAWLTNELVYEAWDAD